MCSSEVTTAAPQHVKCAFKGLRQKPFLRVHALRQHFCSNIQKCQIKYKLKKFTNHIVRFRNQIHVPRHQQQKKNPNPGAGLRPEPAGQVLQADKGDSNKATGTKGWRLWSEGCSVMLTAGNRDWRPAAKRGKKAGKSCPGYFCLFLFFISGIDCPGCMLKTPRDFFF